MLGTSTATKGWPAGDEGRPPPDSISGGWAGCWGPGGKWPFLGEADRLQGAALWLRHPHSPRRPRWGPGGMAEVWLQT